MRITYNDIIDRLSAVLIAHGFSPERAMLAAGLFTDASRDGTPSHGLNRFAGFINAIKREFVRPDAEPTLIAPFGALERWNGNLGPGMLNAHHAMARAIALSHEYTIGAVGLQNTNHWMRGANYGWQAADAGCIGICWTNTEPNMPPWGGIRSGVGNNPLIISVPRPNGHVVLDMAMSQFSYGRLGMHARSGEPLPVVGGLDAAGEPTTDAAAIFNGGHVLPMGFWKGSGLALMLDIIAALVSGGKTTREIGEQDREWAVSQMFIAIDLAKLGEPEKQHAIVDSVVEFVHAAGASSDDGDPDEPSSGPRYPGEATLVRRRNSEKNGVHVDDEVWAKIENLEPIA